MSPSSSVWAAPGTNGSSTRPRVSRRCRRARCSSSSACDAVSGRSLLRPDTLRSTARKPMRYPIVSRRRTRRAGARILPTVLVASLAAVPAITAALGQSNMGGHQAKDDGQRIYEKANCVGCHKWHGGGGGGYGGAALSLRETQLERDQLIEVIHCGR